MNRWAAFALGACLGTAAAEEPSELRIQRARVEAAQMRLASEHLLRSARARAAGGDFESEWITELRTAALAEVAAWDGPLLLEMESPGHALGLVAQQWTLADGLNMSGAPVEGLMPSWLVEAIRQRVSTQRLPARAVEPELSWRSNAGEFFYGAPPIDWESAPVWSGPAVRDHAASYVYDAGTTRIRIAAGDAPGLWRIAQARGVAARLVLDDTGRAMSWYESLPLRLELKLPVWLVTAQELIPATLTGLRIGDACHGGGWTELRIDGQRRPAIWAVLFLPDEATARAARVKRLPSPAPDPNASADAGAVSRLELSWPDDRLPALHLVAKRFGDIWGSYAELAQRPADENHRLSAAGSPECALR